MSRSWPVAELSEDMPYPLLDVPCIIMMNEGERVNGHIAARIRAACSDCCPPIHGGTVTRLLPTTRLFCYAQHMALSDRQVLHSLSRTPFVDSAELALILGEPQATVHRALTGLLAHGIVGRVSHGTAHLPSSQRYYLTTNGIRQAAELLGFATPSDFVRAYPVSREWLTLLIRRMDAVAAVYRLVATMSPGVDGLRSQVEFHRRGRFDATITLHDGRSFGVARVWPFGAGRSTTG